MDNKIVYLKPKDKQFNLKELDKLLILLIKKERSMVNPLLKDWLEIRNQIRKIEKEMGNLRWKS